MTTAGHVWKAMRLPPWRFVLSRWPWRALIYLMLSVLVGAALVPLVILTFLLLPFWGLVLGSMERRRTRLLGFPVQMSDHAAVDASERHHWINIRLTERATWREALALIWDLVCALLALIVLFFETITLLVLGMVAAAGITGPTPTQFFGDAEGVMTPTNWWPVALITLVVLILFGYINACLATGQACVLRLLCGPKARGVDANIQRLINSRRALAESSDAERRRIERDLHDGVQQELIALGARLGMIGLEVDELAARGTDTTQLLRAVDEAQVQAEHAMTTLRDTVRGIHPSVLTDYGLRAALEELAERSDIRVTVEGNPSVHLPAAHETTVYYLVAEALTNIAKHASASSVVVATGTDGKTFIVTVTDNGTGGADKRNGTGLRGLTERAEALNGHLKVTSPAGGPTVLRMDLPLPEEGNALHANTDR
jgi:signal transduction histidine kinase